MFAAGLIFIFVLGGLILAHEGGHFLAAKLSGIQVEEFAFGFPPRLASFKRGETRYAFNLLPLGGYVKLLGEEKFSRAAKSYSQKPPLVRLGVAVAGVIMNIILAWGLIWIGFSLGMAPLVSAVDQLPGRHQPIVLIAQIQPDSPASRAGMIVGEQISGFDSVAAIQQFTHQHQGEKVNLEVKNLSSGTVKKLTLTLGRGEAPLGVGLTETAVVKMRIGQAGWFAAREVLVTLKLIFKFIGGFFNGLLTHGKVAAGAVGPIGLFMVVKQTAGLGAIFLLQLVALISLNLAVINLLPFPALDGGRAFFILYETITGRRLVKSSLENLIHLIGFIFLLGVIILVSYHDIVNFW